MQFQTIVLAGFLGLAAAASSDSSSDLSSLVAQLPSCSTSCITKSATAQGCGSSDYSCQCENQEVIATNAASCLTSSCSIQNITATQTAMDNICDAVDGNSTSSASTSSNSTGSSTASSASASSSSTGSSASGAGGRAEVYGLAWAAVAGVVGLMVL